MTQAEAAAAIGVNSHTVYRWEAGLRAIGAEERDRLMAVYGAAAARRQGRNVPHGTSGGSVGRMELAAVEPLLVRVERELLRQGADDFEVDHLRRAVGLYLADRAVHGRAAPRIPAEADGDVELARYVAALRAWVLDGVARRTAAPPGVTVGRRPGVPIENHVAQASKPPRRAADK